MDEPFSAPDVLTSETLRDEVIDLYTSRRRDLYVGVSLQVPPHLSKEEERLWRQLARESTFDPRESS